MTQAWLMKPLLKKKSKSLEAMMATNHNDEKTLFDAILLQDLADAMYNVMPTKLGDRNYWENFTKKRATSQGP